MCFVLYGCVWWAFSITQDERLYFWVCEMDIGMHFSQVVWLVALYYFFSVDWNTSTSQHGDINHKGTLIFATQNKSYASSKNWYIIWPAPFSKFCFVLQHQNCQQETWQGKRPQFGNRFGQPTQGKTYYSSPCDNTIFKDKHAHFALWQASITKAGIWW